MTVRRFALLLLVVCLGITLCPAIPVGAAAVDDDAPLWRLGGFAAGVAVQDGVAYLLEGMKLLVIDAATQTILGETTFEAPPVDLAVAGDTVYVACDGYAALEIVDVSTPAAPTRVGGDRLSVGARALALKSPYLYLFGRTDTEMLVVYDVSDPTAPEEKTAMALTKYVNRVVTGADHLYVLSTGGQVGAIDIRTPIAPAETETDWLNVYAFNGDLTLSGSDLYIAATVGFGPGVRVVSAADPENLSQTGSWSYTGAGDFQGLAASGDTLYAGFNSNGATSGLFVLDVADPTAISRVGVLWQNQGFYRFSLDGTTLTVAAGEDGDLARYTVATATAPQVIAVLEMPGVAHKVTLVGSTAYALVSGDHNGPNNGMYIYDLTDPAAPLLVSSDDGMMRIADFVVTDSALALCYAGGLSLRGPRDLWDIKGNVVLSNGYCSAVAADAGGNTVYMLGAPDDLVPVDISNPAAPVAADGVALDGTPQAALVSAGTRLYAVEATVGYNTVSIGSRLVPAELGRAPLAGITALDVAGALGYAGTSNGLEILDVSSPASAASLASVGTLNAVSGVDVVDDTLYFVGANFAHAFDVSTPAAPVQLWASDATEPGRDIAGAGLWAIVAGGEAGLRLHMLADGAVRPSGGDTATVLPQEALNVTFAQPMVAGSVTFTCVPDPGGWQTSWASRASMSASQELLLRHNPFTPGQSYTFTITGGQTAEGATIDPFATTFAVIEGFYVYLPLVVR